MKTPDFWYKDKSTAAALLSPFAAIYKNLSRRHRLNTKTSRVSIPVICIGNIVAGGAGKTPTALALSKLLQTHKISVAPFFLTRGYLGKVEGPERVDQSNDPSLWGDEAILLAETAPTIVSKDRYQGGLLAVNLGADCILMDDGMQNYSLHKDVSLCVIDGARGFGNLKVIPQGPLRQSLEDGAELADAFVLIGEDLRNSTSMFPPEKPVFEAELAISDKTTLLLTTDYIAFCGIGYPEKFKTSLEKHGVKIQNFKAFPDHHDYTQGDIKALVEDAKKKSARLLTTRKDYVRLPNFEGKEMIDVLDIELVFKSPDDVVHFIKQKLGR